MRYTTEYNPNLSDGCKDYIWKYITPSLASEDSAVFNTSYLYEALSEDLSEEDDLLGITKNDLKIIKDLIDEKVDYIEL